MTIEADWLCFTRSRIARREHDPSDQSFVMSKKKSIKTPFVGAIGVLQAIIRGTKKWGMP